METTTEEQGLKAWIGHDLVDDTGSKIGSITDVYVDEQTNEPEWAAIKTGMLGGRVSFVPLRGLTASDDVLVSPWAQDRVKDAPNAEADGQLSEDEEAKLYEHYGIEYSEDRSDSGLPKGGVDVADKGRDTSGPSTDDAMTRSEEELHVGTAKREAGRARLRKWIETEHQTVTVPIRKERVEVIREPITDANMGDAMDGPDLSEEEHEIVLSEEEIVVEKRVTPKERVRLDKEVEVENREVTEDVRKERIDIEGDVQKGQESKTR